MRKFLVLKHLQKILFFCLLLWFSNCDLTRKSRFMTLEYKNHGPWMDPWINDVLWKQDSWTMTINAPCSWLLSFFYAFSILKSKFTIPECKIVRFMASAGKLITFSIKRFMGTWIDRNKQEFTFSLSLYVECLAQ